MLHYAEWYTFFTLSYNSILFSNSTCYNFWKNKIRTRKRRQKHRDHHILHIPPKYVCATQIMLIYFRHLLQVITILRSAGKWSHAKITDAVNRRFASIWRIPMNANVILAIVENIALFSICVIQILVSTEEPATPLIMIFNAPAFLDNSKEKPAKRSV